MCLKNIVFQELLLPTIRSVLWHKQLVRAWSAFSKRELLLEELLPNWTSNDLASFVGRKTFEKVLGEDVQKKVTSLERAERQRAKNKKFRELHAHKVITSQATERLTVTLWAAQFANLKAIVNNVTKMLNEVPFSISNRLLVIQLTSDVRYRWPSCNDRWQWLEMDKAENLI